MSKAKEIIKISLILFLITAVSAVLLAFVNQKTAPLTAKNEADKINNALKLVMSEADDFEKTEVPETTENYESDIIEFYKAKSGGEDIGVCAIVETKGYSAGLRSAVGVDKDGKVTGVEIISHSETPGLGANAEKPEFREQFVGKSGEITAVKGGGASGDSEIDAISGATMTSKGVARAVSTVTAIAAEQFK